MIYSFASNGADYEKLNNFDLNEVFIDLEDATVVDYKLNFPNRYINRENWFKIKNTYDTFEEHIYTCDENFEYETVVFGFYIEDSNEIDKYLI